MKILLLREFNDIDSFDNNPDPFGEEDWEEEDVKSWEDRYLNKNYFYIRFKIKGIKINLIHLDKVGPSLSIKDNITNEIMGVVFNEEHMYNYLNNHPNNIDFVFDVNMLIHEKNKEEFINKLDTLKIKVLNYYRNRMQTDDNNTIKKSYIKTLSLNPKNCFKFF